MTWDIDEVLEWLDQLPLPANQSGRIVSLSLDAEKRQIHVRTETDELNVSGEYHIQIGD